MNPVCNRYTSLRYINIGEGEMLLPPSMTILNGDMISISPIVKNVKRLGNSVLWREGEEPLFKEYVIFVKVF